MNGNLMLRLVIAHVRGAVGTPNQRRRRMMRRAAVLSSERLEVRSMLSVSTGTEMLPPAELTGDGQAAAMTMTMDHGMMGDASAIAAPTDVVTWGFGLTDPGEPSAWDITEMPLGEFHSRLNFVKRATIDPLLAPGNANFWHAHDFFVNPSINENSNLASLMAAGESAAAPSSNLSVYWVPSLFNETSGTYVTPRDSSIAYYSVQRPLEPSKIEAMPAGLSIIAGNAMPSERQSTGVVFWNYIGTSTQYDHIPQGDEWQDLPLQAVVLFPQFWDGESLAGSNFKDHMAYDRGGDGGPSSHPYLLPELQLQIHYGRIPRDASLVLSSDSMTADRPGYAPGWSMHADFIHTPWPEVDAEGNLYDGFERRVNDSLRWPTIAGTDGNAVRTNPKGLAQPFTPSPIVLDSVLPGSGERVTPPVDVPTTPPVDDPVMGPDPADPPPAPPELPPRDVPAPPPEVPSDPPASERTVADRAFWESTRGIGFSVGSLGSLPDQARLEGALQRVVDLGFTMIRTWGSDAYTGRILEAIDRLALPLKLQAGIWITTDAAADAAIEQALAVIEPYREHVLAISLGNEQLADWNSSDLTVDELLRQVAFFRERSDLPLTYNFSGETFRPWSSFWGQDGGRLLEALDYINVHSYAGFFDNRTNPDWTPERQLEVLKADEADLSQMLADLGIGEKPLVLGETGWQAAGYDPRVTNPQNMQAYYEAVTRYVYGPAARFDSMFYFNFTDEAWKGGDDHWGLFAEGSATSIGATKFALETVPEILADAEAPSEPGESLEVVATTTEVSLLVDSATGLAYVQAAGGEPLLIRRADGYWNGDVPLSRGGATLIAAARDDLGRLRVLDVGPWGAFAWILDDSGLFVGEEGPSDTSLHDKEQLFNVDLDGDGVVGAGL